MLVSDAGRLWAWRWQPFSEAAELAGARSDVDADDVEDLACLIGRQERIAAEAADS